MSLSMRSTDPRLVLALGLIAHGASGCLEHPLKPVEYDMASQFETTLDVVENKDVDILFVIDNSGSMGEEQATLAKNFDHFIAVLEHPDVDANYRIGITTTDNGAPGCNGTTPEGGKLRLTSCRDRQQEFTWNGENPPVEKFDEACGNICPPELAGLETTPTVTDHDTEPKPRAWIERIEGATNLPEGVTTTDAFRCFGPQGIDGCGFEMPLETMWKALALMEQPGQPNFDFRRRGAILGVVLVTDEADCSLNPDHAAIFDKNGTKVFWSDPGAPGPTSAVCWNAGVTCTGGPGTYENCDPADKDESGQITSDPDEAVLLPVSRYVDMLQNIEDEKKTMAPDQEVIVAGIVGVPSGYSGPEDIVYQDAVDPTFQAKYGIGPGCSSPAAEAVPPVRLREFARAFEVDGEPNLYSICDDDYGPALEGFADKLISQIRPACMPACVADTDPETPDRLDPDCIVEQVYPEGGGTEVIPPCVLTCGGSPCAPDERDQADGWEFPSEEASACFRYLTDRWGAEGTPTKLDDMGDACIEEGWNLEFRIERRIGSPPPSGTRIQATCQLSQQEEIDCPDL
ncbi:MAG: VWA domain-containing protein [Deltaproteobacteria bacterium]|nr:MAG: VWA domain-containing protein [Deltaproteobacteria bacterium]